MVDSYGQQTTGTNKLWKLIDTIAQLTKTGVNQGENDPFIVAVFWLSFQQCVCIVSVDQKNTSLTYKSFT